MKKVLFIVAMMLHIMSNAQSYNGIKVGMPLVQTKSTIVSKGYKYEKALTDNSCTYTKIENGKKITLIIVWTPYTKLVWKVLVYVDVAYSWTSAKDKYKDYLTILSNKYGEYENSVVEWEKPYYEGDGYEVQALYYDKCKILTIFKDAEDNAIILDLDAYKINVATIMIHYENKKASEINNQEKERVNNQIY
jgi:hypothetical protein